MRPLNYSNFYKRHVSEKVRSNFGGKTKRWCQEISKIKIEARKNFVWRNFLGKIFLSSAKNVYLWGLVRKQNIDEAKQMVIKFLRQAGHSYDEIEKHEVC